MYYNRNINHRELGGEIFTITEKSLRELAEKLVKEYDVFGPVNTHDEAVYSKYNFRKLGPQDEVELHYGVTTTPPTKYLFPVRQSVLSFERNKETKLKTKNTKPSIFFGLNLADLEGINKLNKEFLSPIEDDIYKRNRENVYLVSIDHFDPPKGVSFDIHFRKIGDKEYAVKTNSSFGRKLTKGLHLKKQKSEEEIKLEPKSSPVKHPSLDKIIEMSKNDPIWEKLSEICLGCGICTYVCPICYCFETEDKVKIEGLLKCQGCRERRWDSCLLPDFASISSHDFRPELRDRLYNWYYHKFVRTPREHGFQGCVDCGRCIVYCPARINFHETLHYLIKKYS